jgi:hypothetical protein
MIINILITLTLLLEPSQIQAQIDNHEHYYRIGKVRPAVMVSANII